jgi:hypothetical protein
MAKYLFILAMALYAAPAMAGGVVATPALRPPSGGIVRCVISNASDKKPIEIEYALYDSDGDAVIGPNTWTVEPLENGATNPVTAQAACIAKVLKGGSKSLRVSLHAEDSSGNIVAAVSGY